MKINTVITKQVFNEEIMGQPVYISGFDNEGESVDGVYLVKELNGDKMTTISIDFHVNDWHLSDFTWADGTEPLYELQVYRIEEEPLEAGDEDVN